MKTKITSSLFVNPFTNRFVSLICASVFLIHFGAVIALACKCPSKSLRQRYYSTETVAVVKANVTSVSNPCLSSPGGACALPDDDAKVRKYGLALIKTFKGCGPMSTVFYASSKAGDCGVFLQVGHVYLLFLEVPSVEMSENVEYRETFSLCVCQGNILWDNVHLQEKKFLIESVEEPRFICDHT